VGGAEVHEERAMSYHLFGNGLGTGLGTENSEVVRNMVVMDSWDSPWLMTYLRAPGLASVDANRIKDAIRGRLVADGSRVNTVTWGSGANQGRILVKWMPPRPENAVTYANRVKRVFEGVAEGFQGVQIIFTYYGFDFSWYDRGQIARGTLVYPFGGLTPTVPGEEPPPPGWEAEAERVVANPLTWAIGGAALGGIILGTGIYLSVRHAKKTRSR
jgi:hypothetical protein